VLTNAGKILPHVLESYQKAHAHPIKQDLDALRMRGIEVIATTLNREGQAQHDAKRLARALMTYAAKRRARNPLSFYFD
jgi:alcohol dehydrogenase class IV